MRISGLEVRDSGIVAVWWISAVEPRAVLKLLARERVNLVDRLLDRATARRPAAVGHLSLRAVAARASTARHHFAIYKRFCDALRDGLGRSPPRRATSPRMRSRPAAARSSTTAAAAADPRRRIGCVVPLFNRLSAVRTFEMYPQPAEGVCGGRSGSPRDGLPRCARGASQRAPSQRAPSLDAHTARRLPHWMRCFQP
jgi:hypothetical protein